MFTGIIERIGRIKRVQTGKKTRQFQITVSPWQDKIKIGESIAIDGACLTVKHANQKEFLVEAVPATLKVTTLGCLEAGSRVNLERSLKWGKRIGGHYITGHIDGVSRILKKQKVGKSYLFEVLLPKFMHPYLIPKGSIAIDGISLTIQRLKARSFEVAVIPHSARHTTIGVKKAGDLVNLEADMTVKIIVKNSKRKQNRPKHR